MFAGLPKLFDKNFAVGFLLPVMLGLVALAWCCPELELLKPLRSLSASDKALGDLAYLILLAYGVAVLLMATNLAQYRILEGYLPPVSWLHFRVRRHAERRAKLQKQIDDLEARWSDEGDAFPAADVDALGKLKRELVATYPPAGSRIMPTSFGNRIRAFEAYPLDVYGADGVPVWLRLASVIPKDFAGELEDARALVNAFVNLLYLLPLIAAVALWRAAAATPWAELSAAVAAGQLDHWGPLPTLVIGVLALLLLAPAYLLALDAAGAWGEMVKSAFDCFLPLLIKQLDYMPPTSEDGRRAFWREVNARFVYWEPVDPQVCRLTGAAKPQRWIARR